MNHISSKHHIYYILMTVRTLGELYVCNFNWLPLWNSCSLLATSLCLGLKNEIGFTRSRWRSYDDFGIFPRATNTHTRVHKLFRECANLNFNLVDFCVRRALPVLCKWATRATRFRRMISLLVNGEGQSVCIKYNSGILLSAVRRTGEARGARPFIHSSFAFCPTNVGGLLKFACKRERAQTTVEPAESGFSSWVNATRRSLNCFWPVWNGDLLNCLRLQ
jgi:hypothetical protein